MSEHPNSFLEKIARFSKAQIKSAGPRYTPADNPDAPNIQIEALNEIIENLACGERASQHFDHFLQNFSNRWHFTKHYSQNSDAIERKLHDTKQFVSTLVPGLRAQDVSAPEQWSRHLSELDRLLRLDLEYWRDREQKKAPKSDSNFPAWTPAHTDRNSIRFGECLDIIREETYYQEETAFKVLAEPTMLLLGEWGTGKTHLLCDATQERLLKNRNTLLILAKDFTDDPIEDILKARVGSNDLTGFLNQLDKVSYEFGERSLIIIDGVNEGNRTTWNNSIRALRSAIMHTTHIALIVSCRMPFEKVAIDECCRETLHIVQHFGFDDEAFDAQAAFFKFYNLTLPQVPLLDQEFTRPLALKIVCEAFSNLTTKESRKGFDGITSGQKGMTHVLEALVKRLGAPIQEKFQLKSNGCWLLLKGAGCNTAKHRSGIAPCMAQFKRDIIRAQELDDIISAQYPNMNPDTRQSLIEYLRASGLISEDIRWSGGKHAEPRTVYRFPYQRFSDHLIARHLLAEELDVSSEATIRNSFASGSPLSRIFEIHQADYPQFAEPGWAQALIAEFPERVGKRLPKCERELFYVLPSSMQSLEAYFEPFVGGLFWRTPKAFTAGTHRFIARCLDSDRETWASTIDAIAALSTKPEHPYCATRLYGYLCCFQMPKRDIYWSEYLRSKRPHSTIRRVLAWAKDLERAQMDQGQARELVVLFSLVLTTVVREDRDLATKALVLIGEKHPNVLFRHVEDSLCFNDPYVPERMLAAAYGVTLSLVDSDKAEGFRPCLGELAQTLHAKMFAPGARHTTHHTLSRDYALGIIEIAIDRGCVTLPDSSSRDLNPPFPHIQSNFFSNGEPDNQVESELGHAINMDFAHYTIGRLVADRAKYDDEHPDYLSVLAKIKHRMFALGYTNSLFGEIDGHIAGVSFGRAEHMKIDRYGKKYSWIAYFEMWGELEAAGALPESYDSRTPDCDVDPSFPKEPPYWNAPVPDLFGCPVTDVTEWVGGEFVPNWDSLLEVSEINGRSGPWVLLGGFIKGEDFHCNRELFAFLRGVLVRSLYVGELESRFEERIYLGNFTIPNDHREVYLFAGEVGRRSRHARVQLDSNGDYPRTIVRAFSSQTATTFPAIDLVKSRLSGQTIPLPRRSWDLRGMDSTFLGVPIELPTMIFGWESHHSSQNQFSEFYLPSFSIIQQLGLASKCREVDFYDYEGKLASAFRTQDVKGSEIRTRHELLYIRRDLLRRYLAKTGQELVWCNWGEREWMNPDIMTHGELEPEQQEILANYRNIHRFFRRWPSV